MLRPEARQADPELSHGMIARSSGPEKFVAHEYILTCNSKTVPCPAKRFAIFQNRLILNV